MDFTHTDCGDLASECAAVMGKNDDTELYEYESNGFTIQKLEIKTKKAESELGKGIGHYASIFTGETHTLSRSEISALRRIFTEILTEYLSKVGYTPYAPCLVCGLGNRFLTADSLGVKCCDYLTVTGHISKENPKLFAKLTRSPIFAISPGTSSQTGMESAEILKSICDYLNPDIVIVIDSLAARSPKRLAACVQISTVGLAPGSGVGTRHSAIDEKTLGVPVISIGVPTVCNSQLLVEQALENLGYGGEKEKILSEDEKSRGLFVSPGDCDIAIDRFARLIAHSIDCAFDYD